METQKYCCLPQRLKSTPFYKKSFPMYCTNISRFIAIMLVILVGMPKKKYAFLPKILSQKKFTLCFGGGTHFFLSFLDCKLSIA